MYQLNPILSESDINDGLLALGAGGVGAAALLGNDNKSKLTGIVHRYHNAPGEAIDSIKEKGILSKFASDPNNLTNKTLGQKAKAQGVDGLVYLGKRKMVADAVGNTRYSRGIGKLPGKTLNIDIPYDDYIKMKKVANPELIGAKNANQYIERLANDPKIKDMIRKRIESMPDSVKHQYDKFFQTGKLKDLPSQERIGVNIVGRLNYLGIAKGTDTIKGNIDAKYIRGSKHYQKNMIGKNFLNYVKKHPGRFASGVAGTGLGIAGLGTAAYLVGRKKDK